MLERHIQGKLTWIDLLNPKAEEIREVLDETGVDPALLDDFSTPVPRSSSSRTDTAVKVTIDFPIIKRTDIDHPHEIKFLMTKKFLITARYEDMEATDRFKKEFEVATALKKKVKKNITGAHIFYALMNELYTTLAGKLDYLETQMMDIEREIFNQREKEVVFTLSQLSRRLITFRQTLKIHETVLHDTKNHIEGIFGVPTSHTVDLLSVQYFTLMRRTNALFETLDELRETNLALLTTKQNEIMKTLTIMAFITFPLTLFTSMFGMNTIATPIVGKSGDFWIILGIMTVVTITFFTFFKFKRWM